MSDGQPAQRSGRFAPFALLAFGSVFVVAPLVLLRRVRARAAAELVHAPPPRRATARVVVAQGSVEPQARAQPGAGALEDPLHALKAFGIATSIVGATALASVGFIRWGLNVQTTEEFADRMRRDVPALFPVLSRKIHRPLGAGDNSVDEFPVVAGSDTQPGKEDEWQWADTVWRLSRAYEEGGLLSWMEAVGRELEHEANVERKRGK